jgi:hypothetical protein
MGQAGKHALVGQVQVAVDELQRCTWMYVCEYVCGGGGGQAAAAAAAQQQQQQQQQQQ